MKRKGVKAALSLLLAGSLVLSLFGCSSDTASDKHAADAADSSQKITAGTYAASAKGYHDDVKVEVTVDESGKITQLVAHADGETPKVGGEAAPKMVDRIKESQRLDCDVISGASLTSGAILAATEDALKQAGVDTSKLKAGETAKGEDEEVTVDVVVVGAGASGTAAAAAAIDSGAKVLMVEKTNNVGGISKFFAGGPFAVESHLQKEAGPEYAKLKKEDLLQQLNAYSHFINYAPLTKAIVYKSGDTIKWMEK